NPRDFAKDRHKSVDDRPYGGGPGMVMMAEPLYQAVNKARKKNSLVVFLDPAGKRFDCKMAKKFSARKHIVLVCGHYEAVDQRVKSLADMEVSIGDYVLTGGELAAAVIIDAAARFTPGIFKKEETPYTESFTSGMLEAPQYTRPSVWRKKKVPAVLLSGNHKEIENWRRKEALRLTSKKRPDLLKEKVK
ncbi:MAG: tRNA (guanosine(37)-N1)-methyltransferase TrmD, partial [Elusimicrobia bacterium]|nr:tRNA (guanosine(37)-N1)-methyltransferase TrmD [Elusimicrobiota bacterium]